MVFPYRPLFTAVHCRLSRTFFLAPDSSGMASLAAISMLTFLVLLALALSPLPTLAWNIPGHMLSGAVAYQVLQQESPQTIDKVKAVLEKHPSYENQWQARLQDVPTADREVA